MIELYELEIVAVQELWSNLQRKYGHKELTGAVWMSLSKEAKEKFAEIGLVVEVIPSDPITIEITDRITPFDPERQKYEVEKGVAEEIWQEERKIQKRRHDR